MNDAETTSSARAEKIWSKKIPDGPWDYIVIGSGIGGMASAALLSKLGRRVLVLEQHYVPGGFTHEFTRPGWRWDVGVHAVGEVTSHTLTGRILQWLTDDELKWASLGGVYDRFRFPDDFQIEFPDSPKAFRENLVEAFPNEQKAIDEYLNAVKMLSRTMGAYFVGRLFPERVGKFVEPVVSRTAQRWLARRTTDVLNEFTSNKRLQTVLTSQWGYIGSPPNRSSFAIQALVTKHFQHGGYYPIGGSSEIARTLLGTVQKAGGATSIRADVAEIIIENGRAIGVRLTTGQEIHAKRIISAAGIQSTVERLLPAPYREDVWSSEIRALPPAPAHVCLYMGLEGNPREAGVGSANEWFYDVWDSNAEAWEVKPNGEQPRAPVLYCSFPSLKDPSHDPGPRNRHTAEAVTFVPWNVFDKWKGSRWKKRGAEYDEFKASMTERLLDQFYENIPGLRPMMRHVELGTPLSTHHFTRPMRGSIYGLEPTTARFRNRWLRPRAPIDNLFFAGGEVTSVGVVGAMMGGVLSVLSAEPVDSLRHLRQVI